MKISKFFIFIILLLPFIVKAESCDLDSISIASINLEDKSDNVTEFDEATANGNKINLNLNMVDVGDNVVYKVVVKNNSDDDFSLDKSSFNLSSDYIDYIIESDDNSNVVKANSSKTIYLKVKYANEVPEESFDNGTYNDNKVVAVNLSSGINPNTAVYSCLIIFLILLISSIVIFVLLKNKKIPKYMIFVFAVLLIIPVCVYALCKYEI